MKRAETTIFIHFSKFFQNNLLNHLIDLKSWHERQKVLTELCLSFPVFFWREIRKDRIIYTWLTRLIREGTFLYVPNTYSGENHQTLNLEEAQLDLQWTFKNEEKTGYCDLFGEEPSGIYISNRDPHRAKFQTLYHQYRHYLILEGVRRDKKRAYLFYLKDSCKGAISLVNNKKKRVFSKNWLLNSWTTYKESHFIYWCSLDKQDFKQFLNNLPAHYHFKAQLPKHTKPYLAYFTNFEPIFAETDLAIRAHSFLRQAERPCTPIANLIEKNLSHTFPPDSQPRERLKGEPQQVQDAETTLKCDNLQLLFKKGQLLSWKQVNKKLPKLPVSRSYFMTRRLKESLYQCFSLAQGHLSGIRQIVFPSFQNSSSLDYFCLEKEKTFLINAQFSWNAQALKTYSATLAPLELALYRLESDTLLRVSILNTQDDNYERYINDDELTEVLWGESFFFQHPVNPLMLSFIQKGKKIKFPLCLRTKKIKGTYYLFVNLGGFYTPVELKAQETWHQSFSLLLNQPEKIPFKPFHTNSLNSQELRSCHIWLTRN